MAISEWALAAVSGLFVVLWWLYRQRDQENKEKIALLFIKHDQDVSELNALKLQIASKHYERTDLDAKFDKMEETTRIGFRDMGDKFDKLSNTLLDFLSRMNGFGKGGHKE